MKQILKKYWYYLLFIIFFATSVLTTGILAKYTYQDEGGELAGQTSPLYFTVDLIQNVYGDDDVTELKHSLYGGSSKELTFNVKNFYDAYRVTEYDVTYTVTIENTSKDAANQSFSDYTLTQGDNALAASYQLTGGADNSHEYTLTVNGTYQTGTELTVTITSTSPYKKEMKLVFEFNNTSNTVNYYVLDSVDSLYAELVIFTDIYVAENKILIDWEEINQSGNVLQIDSISPHIDISNTDGQIVSSGTDYYFMKKYVSVEMNENMSISIRFFKASLTDKISYAVSQTEAEVGENGIYIIKLKAVTTNTE